MIAMNFVQFGIYSFVVLLVGITAGAFVVYRSYTDRFERLNAMLKNSR